MAKCRADPLQSYPSFLISTSLTLTPPLQLLLWRMPAHLPNPGPGTLLATAPPISSPWLLELLSSWWQENQRRNMGCQAVSGTWDPAGKLNRVPWPYCSLEHREYGIPEIKFPPSPLHWLFLDDEASWWFQFLEGVGRTFKRVMPRMWPPHYLQGSSGATLIMHSPGKYLLLFGSPSISATHAIFPPEMW